MIHLNNKLQNKKDCDRDDGNRPRGHAIVPIWNDRTLQANIIPTTTLQSYGRPDFTDHRSSLRANTTSKCEKLKEKK
jgi:hypothetical protein